MAISLSTHSYKGQPLTIDIEGTTPDELKLVSCNISYGNNDVLEPVIDWKGTVTFFGAKSKFDQFGVIGYKTHKITVNYGPDKTFTGYLLPEVYTVPNTGFEENFSINFESTLGQLDRMLWEQPTDIYSIQSILDYIKDNTDITDIEVTQSFSEMLNALFVYSANFINDDNNSENYMKILRDICTTFGFKAVLLWTGALSLTSCEIMNGTDEYLESGHLGINETYSVNPTIDTAKVTVSNYELPTIPTDFDLKGSTKLLDVTPLLCKRGYHFPQSRNEKFYIYYRQIYEYHPGQKEWHFNKYDTTGNPVDEFDESVYITSSGEPMCGVYPIACGSDFWGKNENGEMEGGGLEPLRHYLWFKFHYGTQKLPASIAPKMMTLHKENYLAPKNTFIFFNLSYMWYRMPGNSNGNVSSILTDWSNGYDDNFNPNYSSNINLAPIIMRRLCPDTKLSGQILGLTIKWTDLQGNVTYWNGNGSTPQWISTPWVNNIASDVSEAVAPWQWLDISKQNQKPPALADGTIAYFQDEIPEGFWALLPETRGTLDIEIGAFSQTTIYNSIGNILLNPDIKIVSIRSYDAEYVDLSQMDVLYSNTHQSDVDYSDVFYMYSDNRYSGRGQLFKNDTDNPLQEITYTQGIPGILIEKPEWHRIRLATKWASNSKFYNDILNIDDVKPSWADRFFNGGEFSLTDGVANVQLIEANQNMEGEI